MTWKELKDKISLMTEEEQQKEVAVWGENIIHTHTKTSNTATYFFALEIILNLLSVCQIYFSIHLLVNLLVYSSRTHVRLGA